MKLVKGMKMENRNAKGKFVEVVEVKENSVVVKHKNNQKTEYTNEQMKQNYEVMEEVKKEMNKEVQEEIKVEETKTKEVVEVAKEEKAKKPNMSELKDAFKSFAENQVVDAITKLEGVTHKVNNGYIAFRIGKRVFAEVYWSYKNARIMLPDTAMNFPIEVNEKMEIDGMNVTKVPMKSWINNVGFEVVTEQQLEEALKYVKMAYDSRKILVSAKAKEKEDKKLKKDDKPKTETVQ